MSKLWKRMVASGWWCEVFHVHATVITTGGNWTRFCWECDRETSNENRAAPQEKPE